MPFHAQHILVPVALESADDLDLAQRLVRFACDIAAPLQAQLTIVSVLLPPASWLPTSVEVPSVVLDGLRSGRDIHRLWVLRTLDHLRGHGETAGIRCATSLLEDESGVGETIVGAAEKLGANMIVIAGHGRHGVRRALLGSVADRVAQLSAVPVLLVRANAMP
jgi:nucleotide-binding universal stress UspA family protein